MEAHPEQGNFMSKPARLILPDNLSCLVEDFENCGCQVLSQALARVVAQRENFFHATKPQVKDHLGKLLKDRNEAPY